MSLNFPTQQNYYFYNNKSVYFVASFLIKENFIFHPSQKEAKHHIVDRIKQVELFKFDRSGGHAEFDQSIAVKAGTHTETTS